jgi:signal peptidase II
VIKKLLICLFLIIKVLLTDQASKALAREWLASHGGVMDLTPFLAFITAWNQGISFGIMNDGSQDPIILIISCSIVVAALLYWLLTCTDVIMQMSIASIIGGALGNIIDRYRYGAVFDFIDFHIGDLHYPAFNLADSAIVIGVTIIFWRSMRETKSQK